MVTRPHALALATLALFAVLAHTACSDDGGNGTVDGASTAADATDDLDTAPQDTGADTTGTDASASDVTTGADATGTDSTPSDATTTADATAGDGTDATDSDVTSADMVGDTAATDATDGDQSDMAECSGACATTALTLDFGGVTRTADAAYYGLTAPTVSASGEWELYVEVYREATGGCPDADSPTPSQTVVLAGLAAAPLAPGPASGALLDFEGALVTTPSPVASLTGGGATALDGVVCISCVGDPAPSDPTGWVALDLDLTFDGGTGLGHVYATHCDSLDDAN